MLTTATSRSQYKKQSQSFLSHLLIFKTILTPEYEWLDKVRVTEEVNDAEPVT